MLARHEIVDLAKSDAHSWTRARFSRGALGDFEIGRDPGWTSRTICALEHKIISNANYHGGGVGHTIDDLREVSNAGM